MAVNHGRCRVDCGFMRRCARQPKCKWTTVNLARDGPRFPHMCGMMTRFVVRLPRFETGCQVTVLSLISQPLTLYVTNHAKVGHHSALGRLPPYILRF